MANYALAQLRYNRLRPSGQPAEDIAINTLHFQATDGGLTTDDRDAFMDALDDWWTAIHATISDNYNLHEVRLYNMPSVAGPLGDPAFVNTDSHQGIGDGTAELPSQCAISHTLKTAVRRRWGRIYLPGAINSVLSSGRITTTALTTLGNAFDGFGTALRDAGNGLVVWHRAGWSAQDVQDFTIDDVVDVIRRRRLGHAFNRHDGSFTS